MSRFSFSRRRNLTIRSRSPPGCSLGSGCGGERSSSSAIFAYTVAEPLLQVFQGLAHADPLTGSVRTFSLDAVVPKRGAVALIVSAMNDGARCEECFSHIRVSAWPKFRA